MPREHGQQAGVVQLMELGLTAEEMRWPARGEEEVSRAGPPAGEHTCQLEGQQGAQAVAEERESTQSSAATSETRSRWGAAARWRSRPGGQTAVNSIPGHSPPAQAVKVPVPPPA